MAEDEMASSEVPEARWPCHCQGAHGMDGQPAPPTQCSDYLFRGL